MMLAIWSVGRAEKSEQVMVDRSTHLSLDRARAEQGCGDRSASKLHEVLPFERRRMTGDASLVHCCNQMTVRRRL